MSTIIAEPALDALAAVPDAGTPGARWTRAGFRAFTDREIVPFAGQWDREARTPPELIRAFAGAGYLGTLLPESIGGAAMDMVTFGVMNEEVGRGCSAVRSLLTVHAMVSVALQRWGSREQKEHWLPRLARGEAVGAFALSEPEVGSDAAGIATEAVADADGYVLNGQKKWTTYGQIADVFLVIARSEGKPLALLIERDTPGFHIEPQQGILGTRAAMLSTLRFADCRVPKSARVGGPGFGLGVALSALEVGRYSVATGAVGLLQACLEASIRYANDRHQFGQPLHKHQLVRRMITDMAAEVRAARYLCEKAGQLYDAGDPASRQEIFIAKYFASTAAGRAALSAVQIHGGNGMTDAYPVERYLRDSRVLEIIEGSTQIMQITIAKHEIEAYLGSAASGLGGGMVS